MQTCVRRFLASCLVLAMLAAWCPTPVLAADADIYDAQSLVNALAAGADVTLWQNVTVPETTGLTVAEDSTIDLNGYTLTVQAVTVDWGKQLTVRDRTDGTGAQCGLLQVTPGTGTAIKLERDAALVFESGNILATGADWRGTYDHVYAYSGGGIYGPLASVTVRGGSLTASGGSVQYVEAYRGELYAYNGILVGQMTVDGGTVKATGGNGAYYRSNLWGDCGAGIAVQKGALTINGGTVEATGGATVSKDETAQTLYGGAGIAIPADSTLTVTGGAVTATGGPAGAGIGGCAKNGVNAGQVSIDGGTVTVTGGAGAFDLGGGSDDGTVGTAVGLAVTGGTLLFQTFGRATNVTAPTFQSCTVSGAGAYQHEGTYNADGKLTVTVTAVTADRDAAHAGANVTLTAQVQVSRTSNLTTPAPQGRIVFSRDGAVIARAALADAAAGDDGFLIASAQAAWEAAAGDGPITAAYAPGERDRYAPGEGAAASASCAVEDHSLQCTVAVQPTDTQAGALLGVCQLCGAEREIPLPPLGLADYDYDVVQAATCTATGTGRYTWKVTDYGTFRFDTVLPREAHRYRDTVTAPTCTAQGVTTHVCSACGDTYEDAYTAALGHDWRFQITTQPTQTDSGTLTGVCQRCAAEKTVPLPKLDTEGYTYREVRAASCAAEGVGRYTWKETAYGAIFVDLPLPKTAHRYEETVVAPTCTGQGYTLHTCSGCGASYQDARTPARGHSYRYQVASAPTAAATGSLAGICSRCDAATSIPLPKLNTDDYLYRVITPPTCQAAGTARYTWQTTQYGTFYFDVTLETAAHSYRDTVTAPTCTAQGCTTHTCASCGASYTDTYVAALDHAWDEGKVTVKPTCTENGNKTYTCTRCGERKKQVLLKTGHSYRDAVTAPTCTVRGYTTHTCASCGASYTDAYVAALDHAWNEGKITVKPTCTENGNKTYTCSRCGGTRTEMIERSGHRYSVTQVEPTCTAQGYADHRCSVCGDRYRDQYTNALGHAWDEGTITQAPGCVTPGVRTETCTRCGAAQEMRIEPLGHHYQDTVTAPTCTAQGVTIHVCSACGDTYEDDYTAALGHDWQAALVVPPTAETAGLRRYTCTRCGAVREETVPRLDAAACDGGASCPGRGFTDMPAPGNWAHGGIDFAVSHGLFAGTSATTFSPDDSMTRAMLVAVLWRLDGRPECAAEASFADVADGAWYADAVRWATAQGIVAGVGHGRFDPAGKITREQMAAILYRYAAWKGYDTAARADLQTFPDAGSVSAWAREAMAWSNAAGLISGTQTGGAALLDPAGHATRAQVAAILQRFVTRVTP